MERAGSKGRQRHFEAIEAESPKFSQVGLTSYIRNHGSQIEDVEDFF